MTRPVRRSPALAAVLLAALAAASAGAVEITRVRADRVRFDPARGERVNVAFRITETARAELRIYDGRDLLVRTVASPTELAPGDHSLVFDGRDAAGRALPAEAYHYTLAAVARGGPEVVHDLTDRTGGEALSPSAVAFDPNAKRIRYVLPALARVNLRVWLANEGPLLRTVLDWVPREAGARSEPWDGRDAWGLLDVSAHPELAVVAQAFALPENTILLGAPADRVALGEMLPGPRAERPGRAARPHRHGDYAAQPIELRRDLAIALELPAGLPRTEDDLPIVSGPVPVRMRVPDPRDLERILAERFETAFLLDGRIHFENEMGFLPATWTLDASGVAEGRHYITGNLLGYEGHFGVATVAVYVKPAGTK